MGDDPFIPVGPTASQGSSNAVNYFINNLGKPTFALLVVACGLSLGLSIGAVILLIQGQANTRSLIEAAERRSMDRAALAEREARIALDEVQRLKAAQNISTDH